MDTLTPRSIRTLSRHWVGRLAAYRHHRHDEHREALIAEAIRFAGMALENELAASAYWSEAPLARRAALLLYLVDRGAVRRVPRDGRIRYEAEAGAEAWVLAQPALAAYGGPALELLAALRAA